MLGFGESTIGRAPATTPSAPLRWCIVLCCCCCSCGAVAAAAFLCFTTSLHSGGVDSSSRCALCPHGRHLCPLNNRLQGRRLLDIFCLQSVFMLPCCFISNICFLCTVSRKERCCRCSVAWFPAPDVSFLRYLPRLSRFLLKVSSAGLSRCILHQVDVVIAVLLW